MHHTVTAAGQGRDDDHEEDENGGELAAKVIG
jgi:hypothetical protein